MGNAICAHKLRISSPFCLFLSSPLQTGEREREREIVREIREWMLMPVGEPKVEWRDSSTRATRDHDQGTMHRVYTLVIYGFN